MEHWKGKAVEPLLISDRAALSASLGESHFREYKSGLHGAPGSKIKRPTTEICRDVSSTLVAFANADGGELLVGVEDSGEATGLDDFGSNEITTILQAHKTHVHAETPLQSASATKTTLNKKLVLYFSVPKSITTIHLTSDGKCLQRKDLESVPVAPRKIEQDRRESRSREYDREYVDGATLANLDLKLIQSVADQISSGMSPEKCLQFLGLADFNPPIGIRLRRAALLLFALQPEHFHPRLQVRILKIKGTELGSGTSYNVTSDVVIRDNVLLLLEKAWENLRAHLVQTSLGHSARFEVTYMYPEHACREAVTNSIAHRDYSDEGTGIEIYIFDDRMKIRNPGGLLSPLTLDALKSMSGAHQSRNSYVTRTLREVGYMRELGEGVRRIFELMKSNELAPPSIETDGEAFSLKLFHRPMYSPDEMLWLEQYEEFGLSSEQKAIVLLGRKGGLIAPQDIWDRLGLVDTEHYRRLVHSLQVLGVLRSAHSKQAASKLAKSKKLSVRAIPRFEILLAKDSRRRIAPEKSARNKRQKLSARSEPLRAVKSQSSENYKIFVGNLPPIVTKQDLISAFQTFGDIEEVFVSNNYGVTRGFGFVEFDKIEAVQDILKKNPKIRMGPNTLVLRPAKPRIKI
jgi:ATP-dependent DNA helicase RecG